jgi:hypothetical protein
MKLEDYPTANSWFSAMHAKGFRVSITLCQAIEKIMKEKKITFAEAYRILEKQKFINIEDGEFVFDNSSA